MNIQSCIVQAIKQLYPDQTLSTPFSKITAKEWEQVLHKTTTEIDSDNIQLFIECYPPVIKQQQREFRLALFKWMEQEKKKGGIPRFIMFRKSDIEDLRGPRFERLILSLLERVYESRLSPIILPNQKKLANKILEEKYEIQQIVNGARDMQKEWQSIANLIVAKAEQSENKIREYQSIISSKRLDAQVAHLSELLDAAKKSYHENWESCINLIHELPALDTTMPIEMGPIQITLSEKALKICQEKNIDLYDGDVVNLENMIALWTLCGKEAGILM